MLSAIGQSLSMTKAAADADDSRGRQSEFDRLHQTSDARIVRMLLDRLILSESDRSQIAVRLAALRSSEGPRSPRSRALSEIAGRLGVDDEDAALQTWRRALVLATAASDVGAQALLQAWERETGGGFAGAMADRLRGSSVASCLSVIDRQLCYAADPSSAAKTFVRARGKRSGHLTIAVVTAPLCDREALPAAMAAVSAAIEAAGQTRPASVTGTHRNAAFDAPAVAVPLGALLRRPDAPTRDDLAVAAEATLPQLIAEARGHGALLLLGAEHPDALETAVDVFTRAQRNANRDARWDGFGFSIAASDKRAIPLLRKLRSVALERDVRVPVRLVRGEVAAAAILDARRKDWPEAPMLADPTAQALSFLACARLILDSPDAFYGLLVCDEPALQATVEVLGQGRDYDLAYANTLPDADLLSGGARARLDAHVGALRDRALGLFDAELSDAAATWPEIASESGDRILEELAAAEEGGTGFGSASELRRHRRTAGLGANAVLGVRETRKAFATDALDGGLARLAKHGSDGASAGSERGDTAEAAAQRLLVSPPTDPRAVLAGFDIATSAELEGTLKKARAAQPEWDRLTIGERADALAALSGSLQSARADLVGLLVAETGLTLLSAQREWRSALQRLHHLLGLARQADEAAQLIKLGERASGTWARRGRGVVGVITPVTSPLVAVVEGVCAALLAGNAAVLAPAAQAHATAAAFADLVRSSDAPDDVLHLVYGGAESGSALAVCSDIDALIVTGRRETAASIRSARLRAGCADIPCLTDLDGLNAVAIDATVAPEKTADAVIAALLDGAGFACWSPHHLVVHEAIAAPVKDALLGRLRDCVIGDPIDGATEIGPLPTRDARDRATLAKVALASRAKTLIDVLVPDDWIAGWFVGPAVFEVEPQSAGPSDQAAAYDGPLLTIEVATSDTFADRIAGLAVRPDLKSLTCCSRAADAPRRMPVPASAAVVSLNRLPSRDATAVPMFGSESAAGTRGFAGGPQALVALQREVFALHDLDSIA
ncbi:MAG: proline dehydrogenase family protein [Pseudomonadota bacterium]